MCLPSAGRNVDEANLARLHVLPVHAGAVAVARHEPAGVARERDVVAVGRDRRVERGARRVDAVANIPAASGNVAAGGDSPRDGHGQDRRVVQDSRIGGDFHAARVIDERTAVVLVGDGQGHAVTGALNMLPILTTFEAFRAGGSSGRPPLGSEW